MGAARYTIEYFPAETPYYHIVRWSPSPSHEAARFRVEMSEVVRYGSTMIVTANRGRSGYAHIYFSGSRVSLIDINLFQRPELNTGGPLLNYRCAHIDA